MIFFKNYLCRFFLILSWLKIIITIKLNHIGKELLFSSQNTLDCYNIFLNGFFMIFSKIIFVDFIGENTVVFITKHCQLLQRFSLWIFVIFLLFINRKAKSCGENTVSFLIKYYRLLQIILFSL